VSGNTRGFWSTSWINDAAGTPASLTGLPVVVALAVVLVLPALTYLLWLTQTEGWSRT